MVKVITRAQELKTIRTSETRQIGYVPTMGNLHQGHISLLQRALEENSVVYFSIFVNPKQFGPQEDFNRYPRTLDFDLKQIQDCLSGFPGREVVVFAPIEPTEIYPAGDDQTISVFGLSTIIEGAFRPGHFEGVATVVYRLFDLIKPNKAYFGLKDYQQYLVIHQMVIDLNLPVEIIGMPIIRDHSGLALSSRNQYLTESQRLEALELSRALKKIASLIENKKSHLPVARREIDITLMNKNWNYLEMRDAETLSEDLTHSRKVTLLGVYQLGSTRLLDNIQVEIE